MPPKVKITKNEIIQTALELLRKEGESAINARSLASALGCSTQPIFSNFATMEDLQNAVRSSAYELYLDFLNREAESEKYPKYKAFGMAYVRFAKEEKELFRFLFMCDRTGEDISPTVDFEESAQIIMNATGVSIEKARLMHLEIWSCVHGIGTMLATSFLPLEWELISDILTDVYQGIRARHLSEVN
ncbi:MAG: TetR/AcrR family transcriptional regulator [Ruminococcaceae bacterium]|nr:TetR/AcrR family transcriptional regulator [Oscillospiraceae bacterium]